MKNGRPIRVLDFSQSKGLILTLKGIWKLETLQPNLKKVIPKVGGIEFAIFIYRNPSSSIIATMYISIFIIIKN